MKETTAIEHVRASYNVPHWSQGYYGIKDQGEITVSPNMAKPTHAVSLSKIAEQVQQQGLSLPALVRFPQILHHRVHSLCNAFNTTIESYDYNNNYLLVYPIKVNQQREVVEEITIAEMIKHSVGELPVYSTFDIDALDPAFAPATGTPVCGGLTTDKALNILRELKGLNIVGMDVVEVAPAYDNSEITALAGATIALEMLHLWTYKHKLGE